MRLAVWAEEDGYLEWIGTRAEVLATVARNLGDRDHVLVRIGSFVAFERMTEGWSAAEADAVRRQVAEAGRRVGIAVFFLAGVPDERISAVSGAVEGIRGVVGCSVVGVDERRLLFHLEHTLPPAFRLVGRNLRVLHYSRHLLGGDDLDHYEREAAGFRESHLFGDVALEDTGLEGTVFDDLNDGDAFLRRVDLATWAPSAWRSESVCVWLTSVDPELKDTLYAAAERARTATIGEQAAQAALSLRRYLERLANALFPAREELYEGMDVGADKWKNRLRAALIERNGAAPPDQLDRLVQWLREIQRNMDEGVHRHPAIDPADASSMLADVLTFSDAVRAQCPPVLAAPTAPYSDTVLRTTRKIVGLD